MSWNKTKVQYRFLAFVIITSPHAIGYNIAIGTPTDVVEN